MKTIYHYDPATGRYLCTGLADECALEPGTFIVPADSTFDQPPAVEAGQVAIYQPDYWETGIAKEQGGQWRIEQEVSNG
ncbi:hypothetical protein VI06_11565 [Aquitalea magnusonii]|nr:hypothetical protein VI06_11565 [Aquitalea magnusonii]